MNQEKYIKLFQILILVNVIQVQQLGLHKTDFKYWKAGEKNKVNSAEIFDLYGIDNCHIVLLENVECETIKDLHIKEGHYIRRLETVNKNVAGRTNKQYREENNEKEKERHKIYHQNHKTEAKEYYEKNKEKIKKSAKEWILKNKTIIYCDCGGHYQSYEHKKHFNTLKHLEWFMDQQD